MKRIMAFVLAAIFVVSNANAAFAATNLSDFMEIESIQQFMQDMGDEGDQLITLGEFARLYALMGTFFHGEDSMMVLERMGLLEGVGTNPDDLLTMGDAADIMARALGYGLTRIDFFNLVQGLGLIANNVEPDDHLTMTRALFMLGSYNTHRNMQFSNQPVNLYSALEIFALPQQGMGFFITPDGESLIFVAPNERDVLNIFSRNLETGEVTQLTFSDTLMLSIHSSKVIQFFICKTILGMSILISSELMMMEPQPT
ncbi:MAG: hypothetical protein FWD01_04070 [Defluviitaleaceae bacterium]|nr:hypothetical protein [Defluviitaleaceae bacterium]